jgi:hypothetical protein
MAALPEDGFDGSVGGGSEDVSGIEGHSKPPPGQSTGPTSLRFTTNVERVVSPEPDAARPS